MPNHNSLLSEGFISPGLGLRIAFFQKGRSILEGARVAGSKRNLPQNLGILNG